MNPLSVLSPRQREVAALVAQGLSDREIAEALGVSQQTARNHLTDIFRRLDIDNRTVLAVLYLKNQSASHSPDQAAEYPRRSIRRASRRFVNGT